MTSTVSHNFSVFFSLSCLVSLAVMAFVLPAIFSFKLRGYSHFSAFLLVVGGSVGLLGTITSFQTLILTP